MTPWQFYLSIVLGCACLALSCLTVQQNRENRRLQQAIRDQQPAIDRGKTSQQVYQNILGDLAQQSLENSEIREFLSLRGYTVNVTPSQAETGNP